MAWTAPTTRATGDLITAAIWNADIANNLLWIGGAAGRGTSFPASPVDGHLYDYVADATSGVIWRFKYNSGSASSYKWEFVGGPPMYAQVTASESTSSAIYVDLATVGPSIVVARAGDYYAWGAVQIQPSVSTGQPFASPKFGSTGPSDNDSAALGLGAIFGTPMFSGLGTGLAASDTIKLQYKDGTAASASFARRRLYVLPVRVS